MSRFQGTRFGVPFWGPFLGSLLGSFFWNPFWGSFVGSFLECSLQVLGFWQWSLFLRTKAAEHGRNLVYINIDESSMLQTCPSRRGVCIPRRLWPRKRVPVGAPYQKRRRGAASLIAMLSSQRSLQRRLPQVVLANSRVLPKKILARISDVGERRVKIWRAASSWVNSTVMVRVLEELAEALPRKDTVQYVIVLDCCAVHLSEPVVAACHRQHWWIMFVPPHCTAWLQPLDCSVFGPLKARCQKQLRVRKRLSPDGSVSVQEWVELLSTCATETLSETTWVDSFYKVGLQGRGKFLSADLKDLALEYPTGGNMPSSNDVLPRHKEALLPDLLRCRRQRIRL